MSMNLVPHNKSERTRRTRRSLSSPTYTVLHVILHFTPCDLGIMSCKVTGKTQQFIQINREEVVDGVVVKSVTFHPLDRKEC